MNRQEIIEQLKLIQAGLTQDDNKKSKNRIDLVIENLKQPISLVDFLGWEENVIYVDKDTNIMYKIQDDNLLQDCEKYLTIDTTDGTVFNSKYSSNNSKYQAQFTLEEIEEIKRIYDIDLCIYDVVRVQE